MVILIHVVIALTSIIQTTFLFFSPTKTKLYVSYVLFGSTVVSGTYLLVSMPSHMLQTCIEGLCYMVYVIWSIASVSAKLAKKASE